MKTLGDVKVGESSTIVKLYELSIRKEEAAVVEVQ